MKITSTLALSACLCGGLASGLSHAAESSDNFYGDLRLRLETVDQDNAAKDATALTLRSRLGYLSDSYQGFSARLELENNVALIDDYNNAVGNGSQYSVVADPDFTELDQAYLQYQSGAVTAKLGRQVLTFDNHRFVGHVGWRQDRQTFDALSLQVAATDALTLNAAYLDKRNRIFANEKDIEAKDWLLNARYKLDSGVATAYAYLLEVDNHTDNGLDTYGARYAGKAKMGETPLHYAIEVASQQNTAAGVSRDTLYTLAELATVLNGLKLTLGYEVLGSDNGNVGFATPLATLHKFNGWADTFLNTPAQGLQDIYLSVGGKAAGGKWLLAYHDYAADEASATVDDLGSEINALYARKFKHGLSGGIKYAAFNAKDVAVDTDKLWLWAGYSF